MTPDPSSLGDYDLLDPLPDDGTDKVYRGRNRHSGEVVAVRVFWPTVEGEALRRLGRELTALKRVDHPNVIRVIDFCRAPRPFLVTELADGVSVRLRIERRGAYPEADAVGLIERAGAGLQCLHDRGHVHRNVSPGNVLVTVTGAVKLGGFDLMHLIHSGQVLGDPHYLAPEQFRDAHAADARSDVYSLGCTLYALATGGVPFDNAASPLDCWMKKIRNDFPSPRERNPALSERLDRAVRRAMNADPRDRPASCRAFLADLTDRSREVPPFPAPAPVPADVWYLVYRDEHNNAHTVVGGTDGIRAALLHRLLGDPSSVLVSRHKGGPFVPLSSTSEFRDLVPPP